MASCSRVSGSHWGLIRKYGLNINRQSFRELAKDIGFVKVSHWLVHLCYRCCCNSACNCILCAVVWQMRRDVIICVLPARSTDEAGRGSGPGLEEALIIRAVC